MKDMITELGLVDRGTASRDVGGRQAREVTLTRTYDAAVADVWSACTEAERISRWMLPVTGDLRLGGTYQLEGNAGGEIVECEPPERFKITWIFGDPGPDPLSEVEVRLAATDDDRTTLTLTHLAVVPDEMWGTFGPGAVGVGWDLSLIGLAWHLGGFDRPPVEEVESSPEARDTMTRSAALWGEAHEASGVPADQARSAAAATQGFYVPAGAATDSTG